MLRVTLPNDSFVSIRGFRPNENLLESFESYIIDVLAPEIEIRIPEISEIRCSASGYVIGWLLSEEIHALLIHSIHALGYQRFNEFFLQPSDAEIVEAVETLIDHMSIRGILLARVAPSLSFSNGTFAIASLPEPRQTSILLNQLLFDANQYRTDVNGMEEAVTRNRRTFQVADMVRATWDSEPALQTLRNELIELDAAFCINKLNFSKAELAAKRALINADSLDITSLNFFVRKLINARNKNADVQVYPRRWTQQLFRTNLEIKAEDRTKHSNVLSAKTSKVSEYNGVNHIDNKKPRGKVVKAAVTVAEKAKKANSDSLDAILASMMRGTK